MRAQFNAQQQMDVLELFTSKHCEYVPRTKLLQTQTQSPEIKQSPNTSKSNSKRAQQRAQKQQAERDQPPQAPVPKSVIDEWGATRAVTQFLEVNTSPPALLPTTSHPS